MKCGMTIEYLKCRKDLNFEVDFRINSIVYFALYIAYNQGTFVTKWDVILFG